MKMLAVDALIKCLEAEGIEYVFGIPGSHLLPFFNALKKSELIKFILPKHEEGGAFMALNYAKVSGKIAVCVATVGPGATNLMTGIAEAYKSCIPTLIITTQTPTMNFGKNAFQEATGELSSFNQVDMFRTLTKQSSLVFSPDKIVEKVREAFRIALSGRRGPVHVCIPTDIFEKEIEFEALTPDEYRLAHDASCDARKLKESIALILKAKRPVIFAGARSVFPNCSDEITALMSEMKIPVTTSLGAKGMVDETHPLALGCMDIFGQRVSEKYIKTADLVISVGEDFGEFSTIYYDPALIPRNGLIQIDVDPYEIGRNYPVTIGLIGDIKYILQRIVEVLRQLKYETTNRIYIEEVRKLKEELLYFAEKEMFSADMPLKPQRILHEIRQILPPETKLFVDVGAHGWWAARYFPASQNGYYVCYGHMSMGSAVAGCLGGKLASPNTPVVCLCGDGGFLMNGMEIATAMNYDIPVIWIILNDEKLNAIDITQKVTYGDLSYCCSMKNPDFVKIAEAFNIKGYALDKAKQIKDAMVSVLKQGSSAVLSITYDAQELLPIKPRSVLAMKDLGVLTELKDSPISTRVFAKLIKEK